MKFLIKKMVDYDSDSDSFDNIYFVLKNLKYHLELKMGEISRLKSIIKNPLLFIVETFETLANKIDIAAENFLSRTFHLNDELNVKINNNRLEMLSFLKQCENDLIKVIKEKKIGEILPKIYLPKIEYFELELIKINTMSKETVPEERLMNFFGKFSSLKKSINKLVSNEKFYLFIDLSDDDYAATNGIFGNLFTMDFEIDEKFDSFK